jgi:hypothetical protein
MIQDQDENVDVDTIKYIPLSMYVSRSEVLQKIIKNIEEQQATATAMHDEEFDKISEAMALGNDLGDMEPVINSPPPTPQEILSSKDTQQKLRSAGVKLVDKVPTGQVPHIKLNFNDINKKIAEKTIQDTQAKNEVKPALEKPTSGVKMTFNDK